MGELLQAPLLVDSRSNGHGLSGHRIRWSDGHGRYGEVAAADNNLAACKGVVGFIALITLAIYIDKSACVIGAGGDIRADSQGSGAA